MDDRQRIERLKNSIQFRRSKGTNLPDGSNNGSVMTSPTSPMNDISARKMISSKQFDGSSSLTAQSLSIQCSPTYAATAPNGPKMLSSIPSGSSSQYSTVSDRIGSAYTPTASGLNKAKAARLAAALGHGGKSVSSTREHHRKHTSVRLFSNAEEERSSDIKARALGMFDGAGDEVKMSTGSPPSMTLIGSPIDPVQQDHFNEWDPMVLSKVNEVESFTKSQTMLSPSSPSQSDSQTLTFGRKSPVHAGPPPLLVTSIDQVRRDGVETAAGAGLRVELPTLGDERLFLMEQKALDPCPDDADQVSDSMFDEIRFDYSEAAAAAVVAYNVMAQEESIPSNLDKLALRSATSGLPAGPSSPTSAQAMLDASSQEEWTNLDYQLKEWRVLRKTGVSHRDVTECSQALQAVGHGVAASYPLELQKLWCDGNYEPTDSVFRPMSTSFQSPLGDVEHHSVIGEEDIMDIVRASVGGESTGGGVIGNSSPTSNASGVPPGSAGAAAALVNEEPNTAGGGLDGLSRAIRVEPPVPKPGNMCSLRLLPIEDPVFCNQLPLPIDEFTRSLRRGLRASLAVLEKHWLPAAAEHVHAHMRTYPKGEHVAANRLVRMNQRNKHGRDNLPIPPSKGGNKKPKTLTPPKSPRLIQPEKQLTLSNNMTLNDPYAAVATQQQHEFNNANVTYFNEREERNQDLSRNPIDGAAALMARQLRESTETSLEAISDFFDNFKELKQSSNQDIASQTALVVEVRVMKGSGENEEVGFEISPSLEQLQSELTDCMSYVIEKCSDFPRIQPLVGNGGQAVSNKPQFERSNSVADGIDNNGGGVNNGNSNDEPFSPLSPSRAGRQNGSGVFRTLPPRPSRSDCLGPGSMGVMDEAALYAMDRVTSAIELHFKKPQLLLEQFQPFKSLIDGSEKLKVQEIIDARGKGVDTEQGLLQLETLLDELKELEFKLNAVGGCENAESYQARKIISTLAKLKQNESDQLAGDDEDGEVTSSVDGGNNNLDEEFSINTGADEIVGNPLDAKCIFERFVHYPLYSVDLEPAKKELRSYIEELKELVIFAAVCDQREEMTEASLKYEEMVTKLSKEPVTSEELKEFAEYQGLCPSIQEVLLDEYANQIVERHRFLLHVAGYTYPRQDVQLSSELWCWPARIDSHLAASIELYERRKQDLLLLAKGEQVKLDEMVEGMQAKLTKLSEIHSLAPPDVARAYKLVEMVTTTYTEAEKVCEIVLNEEQFLGCLETDNASLLQAVFNDLDPLRKLWTLAQQHVTNDIAWLQSPLATVNAEEAERSAVDMLATVTKLNKMLNKQGNGRAAAVRVANQMQDDVKELLDSTIPLMQLICTPGLQDRHWSAMEEITGMPLPHDTTTTVKDMLNVGLANHTLVIEDTCVAAQKEAALVKVMDKMESDWEPMEFQTKVWRTGRILAGIDDIQQLLDDQIVKTQAMKGSRFVKPYLDRVEGWENDLVTMQEILDNSLKVQSTWLYLEPIFSSDDIMRQMPEEGKLFKQVDGVYRASMDETASNGACLTVARRKGLLEELVQANEKLETISKGLNDYLRTKMLAFPRFFFLSNDELLEILAETKDPTKVQPHLKKCFDGMAKLEFQKNLDITSCFDAMQEKVPFEYEEVEHVTRQGKTMINPKDSGGNVELWLVEVEVMMRKSMANIIDKAMIDYDLQSRLDWICKWQGQVVLAGNQTMWTRKVEKAIEEGTVVQLGHTLQEELMKTVKLVRGELSKAQRTSIGALVVLDVHNRDSCIELGNLNVSRTTDFDWLAQMRYYHFNDRVSALQGQPGSLHCRMINANVLYAYEYLGNNGRLVITPLTDRCYRTLLGAIQLNLGGAPEGPAGTGKTETTKDLAKAIAIQCVVFNCSDSMDYKAMGKFFMGLASSGAWACFDEFNRIALEVLSVIAQQVLCIQRAKFLNKERFIFEGTELGLKMTCCPFITMNPGYAGRAELPDNLKVLFRTVAMMVPDYAMIGEIILYSFGYEDAKAMSIKIVTTYKLCSEQLSSQSHYDYGMRAVVAVLRAAGNIKRTAGHLSEDTLILRSIIDVNLCKFLAPDVPLFHGIVSDLFPGVTVPPPDRKNFIDAFTDVCKVRNIVPSDYLKEKVVQTYDMMVVRHGFMIVGSPFAGKTVNWSSLANSLALLHSRFPDDALWSDVVPLVMNPKSITMAQLYGCFDPVSHEWTDGVLAIIFRNAATSRVGKPEDRKWILFDGPVDAIWIENMNTVLDDNKKLCLMSGEIIAMSDVMSMMFEPADLLVASPATVSRCGMVYMEPEQMGWKVLVDSWIKEYSGDAYAAACEVEEAAFIEPNKFGKNAVVLEEGQLRTSFVFNESEATYLKALTEWLVEPMLCFVRRELNEMAPTSDGQLVIGMLRLIQCSLEDSTGGEDPNLEEINNDVKKMEKRKQHIECAFLIGIIWSIGCSSDQQHKFSDFLHNVIKDINVIETSHKGVYTALQLRKWVKPSFGDNEILNGKFLNKLPETKFAHDYIYLHNNGGEWKLWVDTLPKFNIPDHAQFSTITVPTAASAKVSFMVQLLVSRKMKVLICGPTGTGKSTYIFETINRSMDQELFKPIMLGFSAKTSAHMTQDIIDGKLMKRRKGVFGPPMGSTAIIFVDDLNMPQVETYGAQPPIELLRQMVGNGGWYDLKEKSWRTIVDCVLVSAMGPPTGGRNQITSRLMRHFNLICLEDFNDSTLELIFDTITEWYLSVNKFPGEIQRMATSLVAATLDTYRTAMKSLLPTPSKSHYVFNLRDFSRVIQGMLMVVPSDGFGRDEMVRLWTHENLRVFGDRLTEDGDRDWFLGHLKKAVSSHLDCDFGDTFAHLADDPLYPNIDYVAIRRLFYGIYMSEADEENRPYIEIKSYNDELSKRMSDCLDDFNATSRKPMSLVMFMFAIEHVSRICRVLNMPGGNALLVGVGGSGRQSNTILATHIAGFTLFQITISKNYTTTEWREDLKELLRSAGTGTTDMVFLFSDNQIKNQAMVEDINNMLNSGEVPNIFPADERAAICDAVRGFAKTEYGKASSDMTPTEMYAYFIRRVRQKLHIVLAFSPIGDAFRERLRLFPSLINCCAIDWFTAWPEDALQAVATKFLSDLELDDESIRSKLVTTCQAFHDNARQLGDKFRDELGRVVYVTPTSYLELILVFKSCLALQRKKVSHSIKRYKNGLEQIQHATSSVNEMQAELTAKQPILAKAQVATAELMEQVQAKLPGVEEKQKEVGADAAVAQKEADECELVANDVKADLAAAIPALNSAIAALDTIKPNDINEVKKLSKPPYGVKIVCEAVCVMLGLKAVKVPDPDDPTRKIWDFWPTSQKMLSENNFIHSLKTYDKDNMDEHIIKEIRKTYMTNEKFNPEAAKKASAAAAGLCQWVFAMETYERIAKVVGPKRAALAEAESALAVTMGELNEKKAELKAVEDDLQDLQDKFNEGQRYAKQLEDDVTLCGLKLDRATQLIDGLGGEKDRWESFVKELSKTYMNLTGDIMVSAGVLAYLGPFTSIFRQQQLDDWVKMCKSSGIPASSKPTLTTSLGEPVRIRQWNVDGLPVDSFSVDNGIIIFNARRWPLLIDPQGQANVWIRNMEIKNDLKVIKLTDDSYLRVLENCVQFGSPVLLENVEEELDPSLEPLLLKQLFKQGGALCIKLGDAVVEYNPDFRFYITTKLRNPHYLPEVSVKITLLNFMITPEGLEDQLLSIVVSTERSDLQEKKDLLVVEGAQNAAALKDIEDNVLEILSGEGNILEDESAIAALKLSSTKSEEIKIKQNAAKETEIEIDQVRQGYRPVAFTTQVMFFCISDLAAIEPTYQYSLKWFNNLFVASIKASAKSADVTTRMSNLDQHFTLALYKAICRSLLEKDKLVFSFMLTIKIMQGKGKIDQSEWYFLLTGGVALDNIHENPAPEWLSNKQWGEVCRLSDLNKMVGFREDFILNVRKWKLIYDSVEPHTMPLPGDWNKKVTPLERLCAVRCIRPDKVVLAVQNFVISEMGEPFVDPPIFDLSLSFNESNCTIPLVFILSKGSDPMGALLKLADELRKEATPVSLGQGQGPVAEAVIQDARSNGSWVVLQNCHLAPSWMGRMEKICEELSEDTCHKDFRIWCTTYPSPLFPSAVLQNGVKMTMEPPKGLRANLSGSFALDPIADNEFYSSCDDLDMEDENNKNANFDKGLIFRRLMFGLAFFHAILQERRLYGPLGWNIPYEFNESDLKISLQQLSMFLQENDKVPFKALRYTVGECNYGGRVTDDKDRICLNTILDLFYNDPFLIEGANITPSGSFKVPKDGSYSDFTTFIEAMPSSTPPEVFGLDDNATLTKDQNETTALFKTVLLTQGGGSGGGGGGGSGKDSTVDSVAGDVLSKLPLAFDMEEAEVKYPVLFEESMNTVLCQELVKYNRLINIINHSLKSVRKAIKGLVVMSSELENLSNQLFFGLIPDMWLKKSYGSLKPLAGYFSDLLKRITFFNDWLKNKPPTCFWISGFFFTHAFTTGAKQNYARRYTIPIDAIDFEQEMMPRSEETYTKAPKDGVYTYGLFLEGTRWNKKLEILDERLPKVLFSPAPVMWFLPMKVVDIPDRPHYNCPSYKTSDRRGILATTGHSTNFVCFIRIPIAENDTQAHWVLRGAALLTQLDD